MNMKFVIILASFIVSVGFISCKKDTIEAPIESRYVIFVSDSTNVYGTIEEGGKLQYLYPHIAYEVESGQRIIFTRKYIEGTIFFSITADIGKYDHFTPNNQYHYHYKNEYTLIVP